jgi:hypothetical protein
MIKTIFRSFFVFILFFNLHSIGCALSAQEDKESLALSKQVMEAKTSHEARAPLDELRKLYFQENKYKEFVEFLNSLQKQKKGIEPAIDFYIGFTRYSQLRYLEEVQNWDEYFSQGNTYRSEIEASLAKVVEAVDETDVFSIYAKLILWKFHHYQQDTLAEGALEQLMISALACAERCASPLPIKQVADELLSAGEKTKSRQLYKIYVEKISSGNIKNEDLKDIARGFYEEKNLELAQALYDVYLDRAVKMGPKDEVVSDLLQIGKAFLPEEGKPGDIFYAEKIFKKIENLGGKEVFDQELTYARAFHLEKAKEYAQAKDVYIDLSTRFPAHPHHEEAVFKTAMIYTYVLRDIEKGRAYFMDLAKKERATPAVISSLYQLGLLAQWQEDLAAAKGHYDNLLDRAGRAFKDRTALTKARLKELAESKPLEYNLKKFLDVSLKKENALFTMSKVDLKSSAFKLDKKQSAEISATSSMPASGCMEVMVDYLWSGNLGAATPSLGEPVFEVSYRYPGAKEINLVVVSSSGVVDRSMVFLDVY